MDATAQDAAVNPNVTLSIAEAQLPGSCGSTDPEVRFAAVYDLHALVLAAAACHQMLGANASQIGQIQLIAEPVPKLAVQDPTCAKVSIAGALLPVRLQDLEEARELLFQRHPQMEHWPAGHHFLL